MEQVLIIDDNQDLAVLLAETCTRDGLAAISMTEGVAAVDLVRERAAAGSAPRVCLMDVAMPGLHGVKLMRELKKVHGEIRIMAMTGFSGTADLEEMRREGLVELFFKPFRTREVIAKIKFVLSSPPQGPQP
ncbi:MAG: response regulator [Planctomycetota bacterium]